MNSRSKYIIIKYFVMINLPVSVSVLSIAVIVDQNNYQKFYHPLKN